MPRAHRQAAALVRNGLLRPGPDATYADGDDASWMTIDWPSLTSFARIEQREVCYVDTGGDKPVLLFVHGLGALWQCWLLNIPPFMDSHRVIAVDLPGFGQSEMPLDGVSINGYARILDALCRHLGIESLSLVGNSMGGFIGAELALAFPTMVERLVLVSPAGLSTEYLKREPLLTVARAYTMAGARKGLTGDTVVTRPRLRRLALQSVLRYPEKLSLPLTWELVQAAGKPGFVPALDALLSYSFRDRLAEIEVPVLLVWGRNDMLVPVGDADRYQRLIGPNARKVIFEDTGHVPMIERPSRFNALLSEFLAGARTPEAGLEGVSA